MRSGRERRHGGMGRVSWVRARAWVVLKRMLVRMAGLPTFWMDVSCARFVLYRRLDVPVGPGCHQFGCRVCKCRERAYVEDWIRVLSICDASFGEND